MIKFTATHKDTGIPLIGLALSTRNIELLCQGQPIHIKLHELAPNLRGEILLMWGPNEQVIEAWLADWMGPDTVVHRNQDPNTEHDTGETP